VGDKEIMTWLWALVGVVSAFAALQVRAPTSMIFIAIGIGAVVMAIRAEGS
jgi:hypothetical protein